MCVIEHEPRGGGGWNTEIWFFPGRERGESEIRSRSGRSGLSRPGLFHVQPPVLVSLRVPGSVHGPRSLTDPVKARSKGAEPCSLALSMDAKVTVCSVAGVCDHGYTPQTPGVGSAPPWISSGAHRPFWVCPVTRAARSHLAGGEGVLTGPGSAGCP